MNELFPDIFVEGNILSQNIIPLSREELEKNGRYIFLAKNREYFVVMKIQDFKKLVDDKLKQNKNFTKVEALASLSVYFNSSGICTANLNEGAIEKRHFKIKDCEDVELDFYLMLIKKDCVSYSEDILFWTSSCFVVSLIKFGIMTIS